MKIQFVIDYKGQETNQIQYHAGDVALFSPAYAARLISDHVAREYVEPKPVKAKKVTQEAENGSAE